MMLNVVCIDANIGRKITKKIEDIPMEVRPVMTS